MSQKQLLLIILVAIIVVIATVVVINTSGSTANSANLDAVRNDVAQIASSAQGQYMKPAQMGGAGQDWSNVTFQGMTFAANSITGSDKTAVNQNGTYVLTGDASGLTVTAYPSSDPGYTGNAETPSTEGGSMVYTVKRDDVVLTTDYTSGP